MLLSRKIQALGGRVHEASDGFIHANFGSRLHYRIFGLSFASGRRSLPVRLAVLVKSHNSGSIVDLELSPDLRGFIKLGNGSSAFAEEMFALAAHLQNASG